MAQCPRKVHNFSLSRSHVGLRLAGQRAGSGRDGGGELGAAVIRLSGQASEEKRTEVGSSRTSGQMRMPRASSLPAPDVGTVLDHRLVEHRAGGPRWRHGPGSNHDRAHTDGCAVEQLNP